MLDLLTRIANKGNDVNVNKGVEMNAPVLKYARDQIIVYKILSCNFS